MVSAAWLAMAEAMRMAPPTAAFEITTCTITMKACLCAAGDKACAAPTSRAVAGDQAPPMPENPDNGPGVPTDQLYEAGIPIEELSHSIKP